VVVDTTTDDDKTDIVTVAAGGMMDGEVELGDDLEDAIGENVEVDVGRTLVDCDDEDWSKLDERVMTVEEYEIDILEGFETQEDEFADGGDPLKEEALVDGKGDVRPVITLLLDGVLCWLLTTLVALWNGLPPAKMPRIAPWAPLAYT
jgi:hypothetical protein